MIYYYIAQKNNITISGEEFDKEVEALIKYAEANGQKYTKEQIIEMVGELAIRETAIFVKVDSLLIESCTVSFKKSESN